MASSSFLFLRSCLLTNAIVYDLPADILTTLTRKDDTEGGPQDHDVPASTPSKESAAESRTESAVGSKSCALCGVTFYTVEDHRSHIRSDLHGYNLKQRIRGAQAVSEGDFEKLVGGMVYVFLVEGSANRWQILTRVSRVLTHRSPKTMMRGMNEKKLH